jgi:hypothetical protein
MKKCSIFPRRSDGRRYVCYRVDSVLATVESFHVKMVLSILHRLSGSELQQISPCASIALLLYLSQMVHGATAPAISNG